MSQPWRSKPNGWPGLDPPRLFCSTQYRGSALANSPGKSDTTISNRMISDDTMNSGRLRRVRQASSHRPPGAADSSTESVAAMGVSSRSLTKWTCSACSVLSDIADPRVQNGVEQVDEQARDDVDDHQHGDDRDDRRALASDDRLVQGTTDAGHVEDALGDDRSGHQVAEVGAQERRDRDERVPQHVFPDHAVAGEPLGGGSPHPVRAEVLRDG